jgi:hypothetical protein
LIKKLLNLKDIILFVVFQYMLNHDNNYKETSPTHTLFFYYFE